MLSSTRLPLGAPGVYILPDAVTPRLNPQHMDVCAFVGVAPRGPAYQPLVDERYPPGYRMMSDPDRPYRRSVPVLVKSFDEYRRLFGGFEGPGYLPYAVAMFFEQGGRRAYIVRVVHRLTPPAPLAPIPYREQWSSGTLAGVMTVDLAFLARSESGWGNHLRVEMGFSATAISFDVGAGNSVLVDHAELVSDGTLLRVTDAAGTSLLTYCRGATELLDPSIPTARWQLQFDLPLAIVPMRIDSVEAWITVRDGSGQTETFDHLGLTPDHPHSLASVLCNESLLVWPHPEWVAMELLPASPAVELLHGLSGPFCGTYQDKWSSGTLAGVTTVDLAFLARNAGSWGDRLRVEMGFSTTAVGFSSGAGNTVQVDRAGLVPAGTLLRLVDAAGTSSLAYCRGATELRDPLKPTSRWQLQFDLPLATAPVRIDSIEAWLTVRDGGGQKETFERLGLTPDHPRSLASMLCNESLLVWPHPDWAATELLPASSTVELLRGLSGIFSGGEDRYAELTHDDFFDSNWSAAEDEAGEGITALTACGDLTHLVVPDLYIPAQWAGEETVTETLRDTAGAEFATCVSFADQISHATNLPPSALTQLILDPRHSADLAVIAGLQQQVLDVCEQTEAMIALLDVPPGLSQGQAVRWRAQFDSSWGAAYHPWLLASRRVFASNGELPDTLRPLPPAAVAAGIVARKEFERGIQYGPANELALSIVNLAESQPKGRADVFHPLGLNCFVREAGGIQLVSARMLSRDRQWRQLSVRRLILMLRRTLLRETQWAVFEPNGPTLWRDLTHAIQNLLLRLFRVGAWAGATPAESYFVRIHKEPARLDRGELLIDIGVAPAEPLEFIVLQLRRDGDGTLTLES